MSFNLVVFLHCEDDNETYREMHDERRCAGSSRSQLREPWGGAAGSFPSRVSQTGAFLVLGDHHIPSPVTGKEAAPLSASPTLKLFIHIKW